ncbi:MAG: YbaB/EbfC family nucleoid-associated protein, partial [Bacteroidota bacterium]|nr:YbaB/EbfC family nucleoid-associated protein [Bacteroidota bacterium]MDX5430210.1 YbaB/EbfC family nucleoid-associated protein [Bacteroidota bacterium]MDX5468972.1 YbaB/EbfC family nucleoid-associated protein [Bacteroidota bacterium]
MFGKLAEAKQKAEEIKQRLEQVSVMGQSPDGMFRVIVSGNRRVLDIQSAEENWNRPDAKS